MLRNQQCAFNAGVRPTDLRRLDEAREGERQQRHDQVRRPARRDGPLHTGSEVHNYGECCVRNPINYRGDNLHQKQREFP